MPLYLNSAQDNTDVTEDTGDTEHSHIPEIESRGLQESTSIFDNKKTRKLALHRTCGSKIQLLQKSIANDCPMSKRRNKSLGPKERSRHQSITKKENSEQQNQSLITCLEIIISSMVIRTANRPRATELLYNEFHSSLYVCRLNFIQFLQERTKERQYFPTKEPSILL